MPFGFRLDQHIFALVVVNALQYLQSLFVFWRAILFYLEQYQ